MSTWGSWKRCSILSDGESYRESPGAPTKRSATMCLGVEIFESADGDCYIIKLRGRAVECRTMNAAQRLAQAVSRGELS